MDEKNQEIVAEESTIFTSNQDAPQKKAKKKLKPLTLIIILVSLLLVLAGSIAAIILLNKDDTANTESFDSTTILVLNNKTIDIEKINIENINATLEFKAAKITTEEGEQNTFLLSGYDAELIADSYLTSIADKAARLEALREMGGNGDYGFDKPTATVKVTGKNELKDYSFLIGSKSPDGTGYYLKKDGDDKIYLIAASVAEMFLSSAEDLTNNSLIMPPNEDTVSAEYLKDGALAYVDKITIKGAQYKNDITIVHTDNDMAAYKITAPVNRYANLESINGYTELITSGITAQGCYKLKPTGADFEKYGLTRPDVLITVSYDKTTLKIVAKKQADDSYALVIDEKDAIYKVSNEALAALNFSLDDLLNQFVFLQDVTEFKNITFNDGAKDYSFDIAYDEDKNKTTETLNGKAIDDNLFRTYFDYYTYLKPELQESYNSGKVEFMATFNFRDAQKGKITVSFSKHNDRQYLVMIDGHSQGLISYTDFDCIKNYLNNVIEGKGMPNPS